MNPDEFDFFRHLPREPTNVALDLLRGLEDRTFSHLKRNVRAKDGREVFAEDQLVRKKYYDEMRCEMPGTPRSTFLMVFSPDGSKVASTHGNHNIYVTDIKSGKNIRTLVGHPRTPWCIAFHPTSNQIVASGCLGGEVRIWDLSGGSEVWTAGNQSVIASIAFHPNDRVLVIATYNELYFWDWSKPEPFVQIATSNPKEKVRYVAFDKLGHKLITGIANTPQTRWERVRAPVPVPRQAERSSSPYRLRITPRLVNASYEFAPMRRGPGGGGGGGGVVEQTTRESPTPATPAPMRNDSPELFSQEPPVGGRASGGGATNSYSSSVPERERRITASYRNLLKEYELLVQRYLKVCTPPTMIDRGTDPMEPTATTTAATATTTTSSSSATQAPEPTSTSSAQVDVDEPQPSTSRQSHPPPAEEEPQPSTSAASEPQPSTSRVTVAETSTNLNHHQQQQIGEIEQRFASSRNFFSSNLVVPSRILNMKKQLVNGTQTQQQQQQQQQSDSSRKHKASEDLHPCDGSKEKRIKQECNNKGDASTSTSTSTATTTTTAASMNTSEMGTQTQSPRKLLVINDSRKSPQQPLLCEPSTSSGLGSSSSAAASSGSSALQIGGVRILCPKKGKTAAAVEPRPSTSRASSSATDEAIPSTLDVANNIQPIAEEMRTKFLPIIKSLPACDRPKLIRRFENSWARERMKFRNVIPIFAKKPNRRPVLDTSSDSSSSDDEQQQQQQQNANNNTNASKQSTSTATTTTTTVQETATQDGGGGEVESAAAADGDNASSSSGANLACAIFPIGGHGRTIGPTGGGGGATTATASTSTTTPAQASGVRNFVMELEQLLMTILLTEIEGGGGNGGGSEETNESTTPGTSMASLVDDDTTTVYRTQSPVFISTSRDQDIIRPVPSSSSSSTTIAGNGSFNNNNNNNNNNNGNQMGFNRTQVYAQVRNQQGGGRSSELSNDAFEALQNAYRDHASSSSSPYHLGRPTSSSSSSGCFVRRRLGTSYRASAFMPTRVGYNRAPRYRRAAARAMTTGRFPSNSSNSTTTTTTNNSIDNNNAPLHHPDDLGDFVFNEPPPTLYQSPLLSPHVRPYNIPSVPARPPPTPPPPPALSPPADADAIEPSSPPPPPPPTSAGNSSSTIGSMYSNIVHDLETSLNDVRNLRTNSARPGETSDMLSSFSESLENIMNQSDTILRNLGGSMMMLPNYASSAGAAALGGEAGGAIAGGGGDNPLPLPRLANDRGFYVRHRDGGANSTTTASTTPSRDESNTGGASNSRRPFMFNTCPYMCNGRVVNPTSVIESDHNYPRNPAGGGIGIGGGSGGHSSGMSPLMTSLHLTISYIQRQARLLRQQVESIERIDRAMFEVEQLQIIRQLILESLRFVRSLAGESRSTTGMSSVRQMMAGTRISDSTSPYDSEEQAGAAVAAATVVVGAATEAGPSRQEPPPPGGGASGSGSSSTTAAAASTSSSQPGTSRGGSTGGGGGGETTRLRSSGRKTYPPSRLFRAQRHRRSSIINYFPRRYSARPERCKHNPQGARGSAGQSNATGGGSRTSPHESTNLYSNYSLINSSSLNMMAQRLEHLLTEQTRVFTRRSSESLATGSGNAANGGGTSTRTTPTHLGERILSIRLHDCVMRMNRILGNGMDVSRLRSSIVVTQDGATRYGARHFLSLIVDGMSRHIEEVQGSSISQSMRGQIYNVLTMALLLSDILLLELVDSIPPPAGMNMDLERESLTARIDQMCGQMLQNRFSEHSHQLTRSLHHMRLTMRHAYRALGQTYNARRNAMLPNRESHRRQLLNRYLRNLNRRRQQAQEQQLQHNDNNSRPGTSSASTATSMSVSNTTVSDRLRDLLIRYTDQTAEDEEVAGSSSSAATANNNNRSSTMGGERPADNVSSSNNSDDNEEEEDWAVFTDGMRPASAAPSAAATAAAARQQQRPLTNLYRTNNVNLLNSSDSQPTVGAAVAAAATVASSSAVASMGGGGGSASSSSSSSPVVVNTHHQRTWNVPAVQVNDVPISEQPSLFHQRVMSHRHRIAERVSELRALPQMNVLRPRFLHPLYAGVNPFDADLDDPQREGATYDCDTVTTMTPNHRIQVWDISSGNIPAINNPLKNIIVSECKIHNDASVDVAKDGTILVTLLPSGGYLNITNKLGVYSLKWDTLGQCLYTTSFEQNAVSVALSPLSRHLVVGLASRRVSIVPSDRWTMARIFIIDQKDVPGDRLPVLRELGQNRDSRSANYKSVNCIRWLPTSGQGLIYATNTGQLVILT